MAMHNTSSTSQPRQDLAGLYSTNDPKHGGQMYQAGAVLPDFTVREVSGLYPTADRAAWATPYNVKGGWKAPASQSDISTGTSTYAIEPYRHKSVATEDEARLYGSWFDAEQVAMRRVKNVIDLAREIDTAALVFNTSTFATAGLNTFATSAGRWDASSGTPISDVQTAKYQLKKGYGVEANALIITSYGLYNLMKCTQMAGYFLDHYGPVLPGKPEPTALSAIFGLKYIIEVGATKNTAVQPTATSMSSIWDEDYAMVCRIAEGGDIDEPCLGRTFRLETPNIRSWESNDPAGSMIFAEDLMALKLMATPIGCLITNTKS